MTQRISVVSVNDVFKSYIIVLLTSPSNHLSSDQFLIDLWGCVVMNNIETRRPECTAGFTEVEAVGLILSPGTVLFSVWLNSLRVRIMFEDLVDPLRVKGHIDEDAWLVGPSAASAMDTHSDNNPDLAVLTHERAAVIPLQKKK